MSDANATTRTSPLAVPRGTQDVLPDGWDARDAVLEIVRSAFQQAGFGRVSTPTFEQTDLFVRGVGEHTDVVGKEMYTFADRSERSLTLRPEGTAPVVRSFINAGMHRWPQPVRLWYFAPMFRYEAPQKGRLREHYQFGGEVFGAAHPGIDAELITLLHGIYERLGVPGVTLRLNSIGDAVCRPAYRLLLVEYLRARRGDLCDDCAARIETNPLRCFDCKREGCRATMAGAPTIADHLCRECAEHHASVQAMLDAAGVAYIDDPALVRGLDYYTRTTFEFVGATLGAQATIGAGGRYDKLVAELGGPDTPAIGFGCGIERLLLALGDAPAFAQLVDNVAARRSNVDVYLCVEAEQDRPARFALAQELRKRGLRVRLDASGRSINGQRKQAAKLHARFALLGTPDAPVIASLRDRQEQPLASDKIAADIEALCAQEAT